MHGVMSQSIESTSDKTYFFPSYSSNTSLGIPVLVHFTVQTQMVLGTLEIILGG